MKRGNDVAGKKIIAVVGATGAQGGGLARAILSDRDGEFVARAITRHVDSDKAKALATAGAEVVAGDVDDLASIERAFAGCYGAFCVTNYWEHFSPERELTQARHQAEAAKRANLQHVIWSTLEDTRKWVPLDDNRMPTLMGKYKVPHFDAKGEADAIFAAEAAPTSYLMAAFYWENFIFFGQGPRKGADGNVVLALPLGGGKLPGIAVEDIGKCAFGIFQRGPAAAGERFGIAGEVLSGPEYAAAFSRHLGVPVSFYDMPFDDYRALGFPGADDMGNMYEHHAILGEAFRRHRSPEVARALNPALQSFDDWLTANASRIPLG
jgi:uncharacterized protein YbjT (DUF2867 family)